MVQKIFITGRAGVGKSTLAENLVQRIDDPIRGFYTTEIVEGEKRAGFNLNLIDGTSKVFAHVNFSGSQRVGKYGVDLKIFEQYALPEMTAGIEQNSWLMIDEIGKMELLSIRFKRAILKALDSGCPMIATVMSKPHSFIDQLRQRDDIRWVSISETNQDTILYEVLGMLQRQSK